MQRDGVTGKRRRHRSARSDYFSAAALILVAAMFMGPVLFNTDNMLYGAGHDGPNDPGVFALRLDAYQHGGLFATIPSRLGAPFAGHDDALAANPVWWSAGAVLTALFRSPMRAVNALVLVGLAATALALYALLRRSDVPPAPAGLGALIYGYAPIRLAKAQEHFVYIQNYLLVLECAILLAGAGSRRLRWPVLLGLCLAASELTTPYLGYFGGVIAVGWYAWRAIHALVARARSDVVATIWQGTVACVVFFVIMIPTQLRFLPPFASVTQPAQGGGSLMHGLDDVDRLSLRWWNFFLPSPDNPLLGPLGRQAFYAHLGGNYITEQSTMTGYVALTLALGGLFLLPRLPARSATDDRPDRLRSEHDELPCATGGVTNVAVEAPAWAQLRLLRSLGLTCIVSGVLFGLPPRFCAGMACVPTPSFFVHVVLPQIRTISRLDLVIQLGIAILAALGAWHLLARVRSSRARGAVTGGLTLLVLLEYTNVPPWHHVTLLPPPPVYQWLASLPDGQAGIVAQYPIAPAGQPPNAYYAFYSYVVHHHRLFNGVADGTPEDALRRNFADVLNPTNPASWAALGVKTVTIDTPYYAQLFRDRGLHWSDASGGLVAQIPVTMIAKSADPSGSGYAVNAVPAPVIAGPGDGLGAGDIVTEGDLRQDGRIWRWMNDSGTIWVDNVTTQAVPVVLWTRAHNNGGEHTVGWTGFVPARVAQVRDAVPLALVVQTAPGMHPVEVNVTTTSPAAQGQRVRGLGTVELRSLEPAPLRRLDVQLEQEGRARWTLSAVSTDACEIKAGEELGVALVWHVEAPTDGDQTVFLHLVDTSGHLVGQDDGPPNAGSVATSRLEPGSNVSDTHGLRIPDMLPAGSYRLVAGLYEAQSGTRLWLAGGGDSVDLGAITVTAPSPGPPRVPCNW